MTPRALLALMTAVALLLLGSRSAWAGCAAASASPTNCGGATCCGCCDAPAEDSGDQPSDDPCECADEAPEPTPDLPPALPTSGFAALEPPESWAPIAPVDHEPRVARAPPEVRSRWGPPLHVLHCVFLL